VWENGNRYTFRLRPSTWMQTAMLIPDAAKLKKKRWAIVYPNYEYGQSATRAFKELLKKAQPDVEFVAEQATPLGKIDAGPVAQALGRRQARRHFFLALRRRSGALRARGQHPRPVQGTRGPQPARRRARVSRSAERRVPEGWYVTGYPWYGIETPEHRKFLAAYQARWNDYPRADRSSATRP